MIVYRCWNKYCSRYGQRTNPGRCEGSCSSHPEQFKVLTTRDLS